MNFLSIKKLSIINFFIIGYFIGIYIVYVYQIEGFLIGFFAEFLTIPFMLALVASFFYSIYRLIKSKTFHILLTASIIGLAVCLFFMVSSFLS